MANIVDDILDELYAVGVQSVEVIEAKSGLSYNEVVDYLDSRDAGEEALDIYIDDFGYVDAEEGDMRRLVEIQINALDESEEDFLVEVIDDLSDEEPDIEVNYL